MLPVAKEDIPVQGACNWGYDRLADWDEYDNSGYGKLVSMEDYDNDSIVKTAWGGVGRKVYVWQLRHGIAMPKLKGATM